MQAKTDTAAQNAGQQQNAGQMQNADQPQNAAASRIAIEASNRIAEEVAKLDALYADGRAKELDRESAAREVVVFTLVSPHFLFKAETQPVLAGEPAPAAAKGGAAAAPTGVRNADGTYTIAAGDTLAKVAKKFGVSLDSILAENPGIEPSRLRVGQKVRLPGR